jgi:hemerythrin superfamily protein
MFSFILALLITVINFRIIYKIYTDFKNLEKERKNWFVDQSNDSECETNFESEYNSERKNYSKNIINNTNDNTLTYMKFNKRISKIDETIEEIKSFAVQTHESFNDILDKLESLNYEVIKNKKQNNELKQHVSSIDELTKNVNQHYRDKKIKETYPVLYKIINTALNDEYIKQTHEFTNNFSEYSPELNIILFEMYLYSEYDYIGSESPHDYKYKYDIIKNNLSSLSCDDYYNSIALNDLSDECKKFYYTYNNKFSIY